MDDYVKPQTVYAIWPLLVATLLGSACSEPMSPAPAHPTPAVATIDRSAACVGADWIGVLRSPGNSDPTQRLKEPSGPREPLTCPTGWDPVFVPTTDPLLPTPPGLQRFCKYAGGDAEEGSDPRSLGREVERGFVKATYLEHFDQIWQDCRIVGPAAQPLFPPGDFGNALRQRFLREARGARAAPVPAGMVDQVRLVIVDSVQDDASDPSGRECPAAPRVGDLECSRHGEILVDLARELLCSGASCAAQITTRRVLRWTHLIQPMGSSPSEVELGLEDPAGEVQGGSFGSRQDLALAIRRAVAAWWSEGPNRPHLILNLSVGWEPVHAADSPLVRAALRDASCRGALVLAAAGNRVAGPAYLETPLLPAAWEQERAPTLPECLEILEPGAPPTAPPNTSYTPLLFAVGGVQQDGRSLSNARPHATPRLVAFGDHASKRYPGTPDSPPRHETLTGTSVSTLVASAAAARRWSENTQLAAADVIALMWQDGDPGNHPQPVDFCFEAQANCQTPATRHGRRIYVHPPVGAPAASWPVEPPFNDAYIAGQVSSVDLSVLADLPNCRPRRLEASEAPSEGAELCPQRLFDIHVQPWLGPQPGSNHNPDCTFTQASPGTILLEFDPRFRVEGIPAKLSDFTLIVGDTAYRLSHKPMVLGEPGTEPQHIVLTGFDFPEPPHPMYLAVTVNGEYATLTPILQVRKSDE